MAHREIADKTGRTWMVWEVVPKSAHLTKGWLAFQTDGEKRRLADVPPDWWNLDDRDLLTLLEQASKVRSSRRLIE